MQLITDLPENIRFGLLLESETRCPSRHAQSWHSGQCVNEFLSHPVAQVLVVFVCAHVDERQHRDGFGWRSARRCLSLRVCLPKFVRQFRIASSVTVKIQK